MALFTSQNEYIGHKLNSDSGRITGIQNAIYKNRFFFLSLKDGLKF